MPQLSCYRLTFSAGLHIGTRGIRMEGTAATVASDTLFAALIDAARRTGCSPDAWIMPFPRRSAAEKVAGSPPFVLTSALPFAGDLRFFPMPVDVERIFSRGLLKARRKHIKRIRFVSEALFCDMLAGRRLDGRLFPEDPYAAPGDGVSLQGGAFWMTLDELDRLPRALQLPRGRLHALRRKRVYVQQRVPRVTVERAGAASDIFHVGRVVFAQGCGLWFGVDWRAPDAALQGRRSYRDGFDRALGVLADDGLGGERSVGYGAFAWTSDAECLRLPDAAPDAPALLLSRYHPTRAELPVAVTGAGAAYTLTPVAGWLQSWDASAQRRKLLWMLEIGSSVHIPGTGLTGDVVDVRPSYGDGRPPFPHPVWRSGLAVAVGMQEVSRA